MRMTPLEPWIAARIGAGDARPTRELLERYQLAKLRDVVACVTEKSPFYRNRLGGSGVTVDDFSSFAALPFTTAADIREQGGRMLCTPQGEIERIVTLPTSGTTGESKRLFFTEDDLELTVDFFHHGMGTMVGPGDTVIIFLPGEKPDSVGDLLARGLRRLGVTPVIHGPVRDAAAARAEIARHPSSCLVGIPTQMLMLARDDRDGTVPMGWVSSVLLSTDYVPAAIENELKRLWGCRVFTHYGMTETGLGGGVECQAGEGYHLREADLYTEIVDPVSGAPLADGEEGEVVFTTLTRRGMPLVRYRTGDRARFLTAPCPCGTVLRRLGPVQGRIATEVELRGGERLSMPILDEVLLPIAGVLTYTARVVDTAGQDRLHIALQVCGGAEERIAREVVAALTRADSVAPLLQRRAVALGGITFDGSWFTTGTAKRQIQDDRSRRPAPHTEAGIATLPDHLSECASLLHIPYQH